MWHGVKCCMVCRVCVSKCCLETRSEQRPFLISIACENRAKCCFNVELVFDLEINTLVFCGVSSVCIASLSISYSGAITCRVSFI